MAKYVIISDRDCTIDGIGLLESGKEKALTDQDIRLFRAIHRYPITSAKFPFFVQLVAKI